MFLVVEQNLGATTRCLLFTSLFFAIFLYLLEKARQGKELSDEEFLDIVETMVDLVDELSCDIVVQSINDFTYMKGEVKWENWLKKFQMLTSKNY